MQPNATTTNSPNPQEESSPTDSQDTGEGTPLDEIIKTVDGYIKDPATVTPDTLQQLKSDLEDLKTYIDQEETKGGESQDQHPGLTVIMGKAMGAGK